MNPLKQAITVLSALAVAPAAAGCSGDVTALDAGPPAGVQQSGGYDAGADRPSCRGRSLMCAGQSCCASVLVPGGTFGKDKSRVKSFRLDVFEVTVGRMRAFVDAYPGSRPKMGQGASAAAPGSGWNADLDAVLPSDLWNFRGNFRDVVQKDWQKFVTWTDLPGAYENMPLAPVLWAYAQAFCIWDGGRLPTNAEWKYAAMGGDEARPWPWGVDYPYPNDGRGVLNYKGTETYEQAFTDVGSAPAGKARWGHLDMGGSRREWVFDANNGSEQSPTPEPSPCHDCLLLPTDWQNDHFVRDMSAFEMPEFDGFSANYHRRPVHQPWVSDGFRCVYEQK
jgi:formylglycine-generating enzyme